MIFKRKPAKGHALNMSGFVILKKRGIAPLPYKILGGGFCGLYEQGMQLRSAHLGGDNNYHMYNKQHALFCMTCVVWTGVTHT